MPAELLYYWQWHRFAHSLPNARYTQHTHTGNWYACAICHLSMKCGRLLFGAGVCVRMLVILWFELANNIIIVSLFWNIHRRKIRSSHHPICSGYFVALSKCTYSLEDSTISHGAVNLVKSTTTIALHFLNFLEAIHIYRTFFFSFYTHSNKSEQKKMNNNIALDASKFLMSTFR